MRKILILLIVIGLIGVFGVGIGKVEADDKQKRKDMEAVAEFILGKGGNQVSERTLMECRLFEGIEKTNLSPLVVSKTLEHLNTMLTTLHGSFQVAMREMGIVQGRGIEEVRGANYGVVAYNIMEYVGGSADRATLMKTAAVEIEENGSMSSGLTAYNLTLLQDKGYENNLSFGIFMTRFLFSTGIAERFGDLNYYPDTKKELIRALAIGDFRTVDRLVNREKIRNARDLWKVICDRAIELKRGKR